MGNGYIIPFPQRIKRHGARKMPSGKKASGIMNL